MDRPTVLVLLDHSPACATRKEVAMRLARERNWHLLGLAPTGLIELPSTAGPHASLAEYAARARDALRHEAEAVTQRFHDECQIAGVASFETLMDEADHARSVMRHS